MQKSWFREVPMRLSELEEVDLVFCSEGGSVYEGEKLSKYYLFMNEAVIYDLLSEQDRRGLRPVTVQEFETKESRDKYKLRKGWEDCDPGLKEWALSGLKVKSLKSISQAAN